MKVILPIATSFVLVLGVVSAAPQNQDETIKFRNLYKDPISSPNSHKPSGRIINGKVAEPHSIPFQAFLEVRTYSGEGWYCGGSLISPKIILTAGHCGFEAAEATITLGAHKPKTNEDTQIVVRSNNIVVHENFDYDHILNDIALIRLRVEVQLSKAIQIVTLPPANYIGTYAGFTGTVSGWGLTSGTGTQISDELRYTQNSIITNEKCEIFFGPIPSYQICLGGDGGRSSCKGDSGGPLTVLDNGNILQVGIVSYGVKFCPTGFPSVFTRTSSFVDWIEEKSHTAA